MKPIRLNDFFKLSEEEIEKRIIESGLNFNDIFLMGVLYQYSHQRTMKIFDTLKIIGVDRYDRIKKKRPELYINARIDRKPWKGNPQNGWYKALVFYRTKMAGESTIMEIANLFTGNGRKLKVITDNVNPYPRVPKF